MKSDSHKNRREKSLEDRSRRELDTLDDQLPADISRRLYQARRKAVALAAGNSKPRQLPWFRLGSGIAVAASLVVVVLLIGGPFLTNGLSTGKSPSELLDDDTDLLLSADTLEFYDNLEFYSWLVDVEHS